MPESELEDILNRAEAYRRHVLYKANGYYFAARHARTLHWWLGGSAVTIAAVVSTSIFATVNEKPGVAFAIATGLLVVVAAVLTALQTFFGTRLNEEVESNRDAAADYAPLIRDLELFQLEHVKSSDRAAALAHLRSISDQITKVERDSPALANRFYERAKREREPERRLLDYLKTTRKRRAASNADTAEHGWP